MSGSADKVTLEPAVNVLLQFVPQRIVVGLLVTVPLPDFETLRLNAFGGAEVAAKLALTVLFALIVSEQVPMPEQSPLQPVKV